jgi:beta-phosphoglucomutase-like phosphatase (HAD superfamily)
VIFDVDGVLLDLTEAEEDTFFAPFAQRYGLTGLSRDWDSYAIRNDENIVAEIFARHRLPDGERPLVVADYLARLEALAAPREIPGARSLLEGLSGRALLGIATANFREAARLRLTRAGLWPWVADYAFGADGGGHKRAIVARAIAALGLPISRIVYVGDNRNDVRAGLDNGLHFIGFSRDPRRLETLRACGGRHLAENHETTLQKIRDLLGGL